MVHCSRGRVQSFPTLEKIGRIQSSEADDAEFEASMLVAVTAETYESMFSPVECNIVRFSEVVERTRFAWGGDTYIKIDHCTGEPLQFY